MVIMILAMYTGHPLLPPLAHGASPSSTVPIIAINPNHVASLGAGVGTTLKFEVNVTNAPSINAFAITLSYNNTILRVTTIDTTGVLDAAGTTVTSQECVGDLELYLGNCHYAHQPYVELEIGLQNEAVTNPDTNSTSGRLFQLTFSVVGNGFSTIQLLQAQVTKLVKGEAIVLSTRVENGYFTNIDCPRSSGIPCSPPVPAFTLFPVVFTATGIPEVVAGRTSMFDASTSNVTNNGAVIVKYSWDWGDNSPVLSTANSTATHQYSRSNYGNERFLTLTVIDSYGIPGSKTIIVIVILVWLELDIAKMDASPAEGILPGTKVNLTVVVKNVSTRNENAIVQLSAAGHVLRTVTMLNMTIAEIRQFSYSWNTTGLRPNVYKVQASVDPVRDSSGMIIQNDTSNILHFTYVQLVEDAPGGFGVFFGLSFFPTLGVWAVLAGGVAAAVRFLVRKKPTDDKLP